MKCFLKKNFNQKNFDISENIIIVKFMFYIYQNDIY